MASSSAQLALTFATGTTRCRKRYTRKSYTREFKLSVVAYYKRSNLCQTSRRFSLNTKTVLRWKANEEKIENSPKQSVRVKYARTPCHPEMEAVLYEEFLELQQKGLKVNGPWLQIRAREILSSIDPEASFLFSEGWLHGFKARNGISFARRLTPNRSACENTEPIHREVNGTCCSDIQTDRSANMDQTEPPPPLYRDNTYNQKTVCTLDMGEVSVKLESNDGLDDLTEGDISDGSK